MEKDSHYGIVYKNKRWKKQSFISRVHAKYSGCVYIVQYDAAIKEYKASVYVLI